MILVLFGPPGAGKGTQAERLKENFNLEHLSSGDMLRGERASGTELGNKVAGYMDAGELVPDEVIIDVVLNRLLKPAKGAGYLLDGFPRTLPQARKMDEALGNAGEKVDMVLSLAVADELIVERITGRLTAPQSGMVYHKKYKPPKVAGVCDVSGEKLVQREDDTEEVVRERLRAYHEQTAPLEDYYRQKDVLVEIDGTKGIDEISQQATKLVKDYQAESGR